ILPSSFARSCGLGRGTPLPHVRLRVQPNRSALGNELERVLEQVGDYPLQLGRIEGKHRKLVVGQKVKRQSFFLKASRPQATNFGEALVDVAYFELHLQPAGFEGAVHQKILNE